MKLLNRCIQYDLTRSIVNKTYFLKILLIGMICLISHADVLRAVYMGNSLKGYDIIGVYNFTIHYDRFKIILLIVIASIYTYSFCIDVNNHALKYILARSGINRYIIAKIVSIFISAAMAYLSGLFLSFVVLYQRMPIVEAEQAFYPASGFFSFASLSPQEHPFLWILLTSILFILSVTVLCIIGFYISLHWADSLITICIPAILYFGLTSLTSLLPTIFFLPGYGNNIRIISDNVWVNYGFKIAVNIIVMILFVILSCRKMRRMKYEGTI